ncbi:MAG TPA: bacillithiol biosynthesis cysteine-adding enzyme BshC [Bryobacteraceae bacterium]|nr:bacillithiol biosynthesis cysteine-adding enzyme BshC [Bryobacteraceae bacterium]
MFADFSYHYERVSRFYRHNPHDPSSFAAAAKEIEYPDERRFALVRALEAQNGDSENLRRLAQPGTVAVVTGQQVGIFGGPAYTVYKAVSAVRLARDLSAQGIPAVPLFWLASEDHDFAEAASIWTFGPSQEPVRLSVHAPEANGRPRPVGSIRLPKPPTEELRKSLAAFPDGERVSALVEEAYRPGVTMAEGFRALLRAILPKAGLIPLDPLDPKIRSLSAPLVSKALGAAGELKARLLERNRDLTASGYHAQVHLEPKTSLFFLLENGERAPLRLKDSEFDKLRERAADISPNALLRPVMQDYLLPTVAYIGGPAELAYFAQSQVIYERLLGRMPVVQSRCGFTLLDQRAAKLLDRYQLAFPEALAHEQALKQEFARALVPETVERAFEETSREIQSLLGGLEVELERFDHTLGAAFAKSRAKMLYQVEKLRRKTGREAMRRNERAASDARFLHNLIFPHRHLQERFYSILPFLAKHGVDMVDRLLSASGSDCPDHRILIL